MYGSYTVTSITNTGGPDGYVTEKASAQVDGFGIFDLILSAPDASNSMTNITVTLTGSWANAQSVLGPDATNTNPYLAAAHLRAPYAVDLEGNKTFKVAGDSFTTVVPIPAAAWLLGTGLVGLVLIKRRMKK